MVPSRSCWVALAAVGMSACTSEGSADLPDCPEVIPSADLDVAGTWRYRGSLRGTIALEQTNQTVTLTNTTYENADDRPLIGTGQLVGNELTMHMVPENGDTNYSADVRFVFSEDGKSFCVQFSDTNDDKGPLGSYTGTLISP